jgi:hypothetical protein
MSRLPIFGGLLLACLTNANGQWQLQESHTTAGLRGIHNVAGGVAWASGTGGTVLRTTDDGTHWQRCAIPDATKDGATLDFRGVQARDERNAIIMSSGPGGKSRLYKTTDGCKSWKLILKNRDRDGFWDAIYFENRLSGWLLGDPVNGRFSLFHSADAGRHWIRQNNKGLRVDAGRQGAFAASNSSLISFGGFVSFGSGGTGGAWMYSMVGSTICLDDCSPEEMNLDGNGDKWERERVSLGRNTDSSGVFSIGARAESADSPRGSRVLVIVGGDYSNPNQPQNSSAFKVSLDRPWTVSTSPPRGYRSSVQWSEPLRAWIAVGPNGTDISTDDGRNWSALKPLESESPGADQNWNALSLPFVVGPNGRIGKFNASAPLLVVGHSSRPRR